MNAAATQHRTAGARQFFTATPQTPSQSARSLYTFPLYCRTRVDALSRRADPVAEWSVDGKESRSEFVALTCISRWSCRESNPLQKVA